MAAFLKEIEKFYGTKEKNRQGEDLETFLEHYDPRKYETPSCTTDAVIFSITGRASGGESAERCFWCEGAIIQTSGSGRCPAGLPK